MVRSLSVQLLVLDTYSFIQGLQSYYAVKVSTRLPFNLILNKWGCDFPLQKNSETFLQPEMLKIPVCDEVAGPTVYYLVNYHVC